MLDAHAAPQPTPLADAALSSVHSLRAFPSADGKDALPPINALPPSLAAAAVHSSLQPPATGLARSARPVLPLAPETAAWGRAGFHVARNVYGPAALRRLVDAAVGAVPSVPSDPALGGLANPHALTSCPAICGQALDLLAGSAIGSELATLDPLAPRHALVRSDLAILIPQRLPQQDGYSFDSRPRGRIIGAWLALEDIEEAAGRPFILEGSHRHGLSEAEAALHRHDYLEGVGGWVSNRMEAVRSPALRRGDVLFWHGHTVFGTLPRLMRGLTGASLVGWYAPLGLELRSRDGKPLPGPHPHVAVASDPRRRTARPAFGARTAAHS